MQITKLILPLVLFLFLFSCNDGEDVVLITVENVSGKWETNDALGIQSIEFNESNSYIIIELKEDSLISSHYGVYTIRNNSEIDLNEFGLIQNIDLSDGKLGFSIENLDGIVTDHNLTSVEEVIATTANSETLCRTWNLISINGIPALNQDGAAQVIFSEVGT